MKVAKNNYDIFIVGMGPIGLFAANVFGHYGYEVCVIEKYEGRLNFPRAIQLDSEVVRGFQFAEMEEELLKVLTPSGGLHLINHKGDLMAIFNSTAQDGYSPMNLFYQPELEEVLESGIDRFSNVHKYYGVEFLTIDQSNEEGIKLTCKDVKTGEVLQIDTKFLIGSDGAKSTVRQILGIEEQDFKYDGAILKVDVTEKSNPQPFEEAEQFCSSTFPYIRMSAHHGHKRFEYPLIHDPNAKKETYENPEKIAELLKNVGEDPNNLSVEHVILYHYRSVIQKQWRKGRALIAGDAAHLTPPFIGQGMCGGMRDVINMAWKIDEILQGKSENNILETYQSERQPNFQAFLEGAFLVGDAYKSDWDTMPFPLPPDKVMAKPHPPLGEGLFSDTAGSHLIFPQTDIQVNGKTMRSDDYFGRNWTLISLGEIDAAAKTELLDKKIKHIILSKEIDTTGLLRNTLQQFGATCAILRPDKYIFATGQDAMKLVALVRNRQIHLADS